MNDIELIAQNNFEKALQVIEKSNGNGAVLHRKSIVPS